MKLNSEFTHFTHPLTSLMVLLAMQFFGIGNCAQTIGQQNANPNWELDSPIEGSNNVVPLEPSISSGAFQIEAQIRLEHLDGSAASVALGEKLNFGFDGRAGTFFIEGQVIGTTVLLAKTSSLLRERTPFHLSIHRTKEGLTTFAIDDIEVYATKQLMGKVGRVRFRPMRNTLSVMAATVHGNIETWAEGVYPTPINAPVLNDGSSQPVLNLRIKTKEQRVIRKVGLSFTGTTDLNDLGHIFMVTKSKPTVSLAKINQPKNESVILELDTTIRPGLHEFTINCELVQDAKLANRIGVSLTSIHFDDETSWQPKSETMRNDAAPGSLLRIAHCIHKKGQHDCHTFRIPAVAVTPNGTLLAVYDMRYNSSRDLQEHIDIGLSRSTDGGETWSKPTPIMDMGEYGGKPQKENGCSDPGILVDSETGEIFVSAVWTFGKPNTHQWTGKGSESGLDINSTAQFLVVRSTDDGQSWSEPENWTRKLKKLEWWLFAPAPGNGITLRDGTLVMPTQGRDQNGTPFSNVTYSRDHGRTWTVSKPARSNTTENAVVELSDGRLMLNMRDNRNRKFKGAQNGRAVGVSDDLGATWKTHASDHSALPEPVCMASLISHDLTDGRRALIFSNPNDKHRRRRMTIQLSLDDGTSWPKANRVLLDELGGAYSSLVMIDADTIGILYESSRADLVFQKIKLVELISN